MYKLAFRFQDIGQSAAMSVVNLLVILLFVLFYLRVVDWRRA
jgi:ABC-type sugar transport system permease subunit